ncbi:MAG: glycosyltransferase [Anaerolineae bacterium]|nr:glycosyltransferase [Anaerolineae bacterium]
MTTGGPTFSLIVNTTDRAGPLQTLLHALEHQSYPHFEVVIVVGPTRDNTLEVLSAYEGRVRVLRCPAANLSRSRNIGLLGARGDIVAYIDDDAVPCQRWLEQLAKLFEDPLLTGTGGAVYMIYPQESRVQHRIGVMSSLFEHKDVRASWLEYLAPPGMGCRWAARMMGTNMAFRRQAVLEVGGFDEFFVYIGEETDLILRMIDAGYLIHPVMEAPVYHIPASSRHRRMFSAYGKWWLQTRSGVYFAIKNGLKAGDPVRHIVLRCLHLVHGHWIGYGQYRRERKITWAQLWVMRLGELYAVAVGALAGLFAKRRLLDRNVVQSSMNAEAPILRFQNDHSGAQGPVDPIGGRLPLRELPAPPLRLCLLSGQYPPEHYDGIGRLTHLMARGLFELGHTVHVVTRGDTERIMFYDGAYVHHIPPCNDRYSAYRRFPNLFYALNYSHAVYEKVRRLVMNDGVHLVDSPLWQFEGLVTAVSGIIPTVVRLVTAFPQVTELQREHSEDTRLVAEMERMLIERADRVLPNTYATLESVRDMYRLEIAADRYTVVPYGIVPAADEAIRPFDPRRAEGPLTVLFVGRLEKRKGILDLFQAIPAVLQAVPETKFIMAGRDNSEHDGFLRQTGMNYPAYFLQRYGRYASRVEFRGQVSDEELQSLYQSCDLFVAPSLYESFGLIYLEAMNYAKPVIGCYAGGVPEVVENGITGLLVDPGAPHALAEAMVSLLRSPARLREMGLAGRQRLLDKFTYIRMARDFEQAYRAVLQRSAERARVLPQGQQWLPAGE